MAGKKVEWTANALAMVADIYDYLEEQASFVFVPLNVHRRWIIRFNFNSFDYTSFQYFLTNDIRKS